MSRDTEGRLNPDKIVTSALAIADSEGLGAVTVRRLAQEHGVTPMALYRHFRDKEQLFDAIAERLFTDVVLPEPSRASWHEQLRALLGAFLESLKPHPNAAELALTRILSSPAGLVLTERTLSLLASAGFPTDQAAQLASQSLCSLVTLVTTEPGATDDPQHSDESRRAKRATLAALSPERYPHIIAAADALTRCSDRPTYFDLGVDVLVAGMRGLRPGRATR